MNRLRLAALTGLLMAGAVLAPLPATAGATTTAPSAPYTVFTWEDGSPTDGIGGVTVFEPGSGAVTVSGDADALQLTGSAASPADIVNLSIQAPTGHSLAVGTYDVSYVSDATHVGVSVSRNSWGCSVHGGTFQIRELTFGAQAPQVTTLAVTYAINCDNHVLSGEVRLASSIGYTARTLDDDQTNWPYTYIGDLTPKRTWTLTSRGTESLVVSTVDLTGPQADSYVIVTNTCDGVTLTYGQTCTVQVVGRPTVEGSNDATLVVHDNDGEISLGAVLYVYGQYSDKGSYAPISPLRVLDTRTTIGGHHSKVGPGGTVTITLPSSHQALWGGITAMALNLTVTGETAPRGYITAYATGSARPTASNLNYVKGVTRANHVIVPVSSTNRVTLYNCCGSVDLIADVEGVFDQATMHVDSGYDYFPARPTRMLDTRDTAHWRYGALKPGYEASIPIDFGAQWRPATAAFAVNVTAVSPSGGGYLTAFAGDADPRRTSTVNYTTHVTTANLAITPVEICHTSGCSGIPEIRVYNGGSRAVHVLVDVVGFYGSRSVEPGLRFTPIAPTRVVDTRIGQAAHPFGPAEQQSVVTPSSIAGYDTYALAENVTAVTPTTNTYLTLWPQYTGETRPGVSTLNAAAGSTVANGALTEVGPGNVFDVYNSSGTTNVLVDVSGRFDVFPSEDPNPLGSALVGGARGARPAGQRWAPVRPVAHQAQAVATPLR